MKKNIKNYLSLLLIVALLFSDFAPFFRVQNVKAEEITTGLNLSGVSGDSIDIDLINNPEATVSIDNEDYSINCYSTDPAAIYIMTDGNSCTFRATEFAKGTITIDITNINNEYDTYERLYSFDTGVNDYLNNLLDRLPNEVYDNVDYYGYISSFIPNNLSISTNADYENDLLNVEIDYSYVTYDGVDWDYNNHVRVNKDITIVHGTNNSMSFYLPQVEMGSNYTIQFANSGSNNINYNNLVWTSDDPNIATVSSNGVVTGISPGLTYINVYDKENRVRERASLVVNDNLSYLEKIDNITNIFSGNVVINVADVDVYIDDFENIYYENIVMNYMGDYLNNLNYNMYLSSINCSGNECNATVNYYNEDIHGNDSFDLSFTVSLMGIYVRTMSVDYGEEQYLYYHVFDDSGLTEIEYNNEYLTVVDEGDNYFKLHGNKIGATSINLTNGDKEASTMVAILPYFGDVTSYSDSIRNLELPYNSNEILDSSDIIILEDIISNKVKNDYQDDEAREYLIVNTTCFNKNKCKVTLDFNIVNHNTSSVWVDVSYTNTIPFNLLKNRISALETTYNLNFADSITLADSCDSVDCILNNAYHYTDLDNISDASFVIKSVNLLMPNVPLSVTYLVTINDELGTYTKEVTVNMDYIISAPVTLEEDEYNTYISNQISTVLDKNVTILKNDTNKYQIDDNYYICFDKKDIVELINVYAIKGLISINSGDSEQVVVGLYPANSNHYTLTYSIDDPSIATVTSDGIVTGVSEGYTRLDVSGNNSVVSILILVDTPIEDHLNYIIDQIPDELELNYADLAYNDLESLIRNESSNTLYRDNLFFNNFSIDVEERQDRYYIRGHYTNYSTNEDYYSDEKEITFIFKGIKVDQNIYYLEEDDEVDIHLEFSEGDNINISTRIINPDVISYDNGVITALKPGIAIVYFNDKYNEYFNYIKIIVDRASMLLGFNSFLNDKDIIIDYAALSDEYSLNSAFYQVFDELYSEYFGTWDTIGYGTNVECDPGTLTCNYSIFDENYSTIYTRSFNYTLKGINIDSNRDDIYVNEHIPVEYETVGTSDNVTVTSLDTYVCTIVNNEIVGVNPGVCTVKYDNGEYVNYKHVFVGVDDYTDYLNDLLDELPDELAIDLDPYVTPEDLGWQMEVYAVTVAEKLKEYIADGLHENESFMISLYPDDIDTLNDGYVDISISAQYSFNDYNSRLYYYDNFTESDSKQITVTFNGISNENREIADNLLSTMRRKYLLTLTEYMKYRIDVENGTSGDKSLIDYSGFISDLNSVCNDCEFKFIGGYGDDELSHPVQGGVILIYRNGTAITYFETEITVDISVTQSAEEILTEDEYIERVVDSIKDAYREAKALSLSASLAVGSINGLRLANNDDVEVTVEKGFDETTFRPEYTFTVNNDFSFTTSVETKVSGTRTYESYVSGVEVDKDEVTVYVSGSDTVVATVTPDNALNKGVTWVSNDPTIASVEDGVITGLSVGDTTVTVTTDEGNFEEEITVHVISGGYTNPIVNSITIVNRTWNSITVRANTTEGTNSISKYYFKTNHSSYVESNSNEYTFTGLNPSDDYTISVYVTDSNYNGVDPEGISAVKTIDTSTLDYNYPTIAVEVTKTTNSITLNATATKGDGNIAKFAYSNDNGETWIEQNTSSLTDSYTFTGLNDNTDYQIKVKVYDVNNKDGLYSATIKTNYIEPTITGVTKEVTSDSITLTINATPGSTAIDKYFFRTSDGSYDSGDNSNTKTYTGLNSEEEYTFYVKLVDVGGHEVAEQQVKATTSGYNNPTVVLNGEVETTYNSITVRVNGSANEDGATISKYSYIIDDGIPIVFNTSSTSSEYTFNVEEGGTHNIQVIITDSNDKTGSLILNGIATPAYNKPSITSVTPGTITNKSIQIVVVATDGDNTIKGYKFSIDGGSTYSSLVETTNHNYSYTFDNLVDNTNYSIKVKVVDTLNRESNVGSTSATTAYIEPKVTCSVTDATTNSLKVIATATPGSTAIASYNFKKGSEGYKGIQTSNSYIFTGLDADTTYTFTVEVTDNAGHKATKTCSGKTTVSSNNQNTENDSVNQTKLGDVNLDGKVNITDLIKLRKFVAGIETLGSQEQKNADINKDNSVNIVDIVKLRKHLAGLEEI